MLFTLFVNIKHLNPPSNSVRSSFYAMNKRKASYSNPFLTIVEHIGVVSFRKRDILKVYITYPLRVNCITIFNIVETHKEGRVRSCIVVYSCYATRRRRVGEMGRNKPA